MSWWSCWTWDLLNFRNELKAQFRALYEQTQSVTSLTHLPTYYNYSSYLPMTYVSGPVPAQVEQDSVSPPGDRRRAFSPERAQSGSKYHPYYVVGGQQDRRPLPLQAGRRSMAELATATHLQQASPHPAEENFITQWLQTLPLVQPLPVSPLTNYYDPVVVSPPGGQTLVYSHHQGGQWPIPTLSSTREK